MRLILALTLCCRALAGGEPLPELDRAFHEAYAAARTLAFDRQGPVLVVDGDRLVLYRDQAEVAQAVIRPPSYHRLKSISHVPLTLRLLLGTWGEGPLDPARMERLRVLRGQVGEIGGGGAVLGPTVRFLDATLAAGRVSRAELDAYGASLKGPLEALAREAAALELEALSGAVSAWRRTWPAGDWEALRVVVIGAHMAREGEVSLQFFQDRLGESREGGRVVYAEEKWDPREALELLARHRVDRDLGTALFGDPARLHRDVLADGARAWLEAHPVPK